MGTNRYVLWFWVVLLVSCSGTDNATDEVGQENPEAENFTFSDGFEVVDGNFQALFPEDGSRWSGVQLVNPTNKENNIGLTTTTVLQGNYALSVMSTGSNDILSKIDLEKSGFGISEGQTLTVGAHFYIESDVNIQNLLLMDIECCSCWDPTIPNNQCPGVRLIMAGDNDYLAIERGKIGLETLTQSSFAFPRNEWVKVQWTMQFSPEPNGTNQLFINDTLVIDEQGANMPNEIIFRNIFLEEEIEFELQTPVRYERVQIGATANPTDQDIQIYIDDFFMEVISN